jgi:hypothetical protein
VTDLLPLLQEFYREKLTAVLRHEAAAKYVSQYDANNAYQFIINRDETQLSWIARSIVDLGGEVPAEGAAVDRKPSGKGPSAANGLYQEDAREAQAFVDRWQARVEQMVNARHRGMLRVVLGEVLEQKRFFEQAAAGRMDLLGRRTEDVGVRVGEVLPTRWIE